MANSNYGIHSDVSNIILDLLLRQSHFVDTTEYYLYSGGDKINLFNKSATSITNLYIGLSTTQPTTVGGNFTEPSSGGYARSMYYYGADYWEIAASGASSNKSGIVFPRVTATWGTITHFGIFLASSGGTARLWGALSASETPVVNTVPVFAANTLSLNLVGGA